MPLPVRELTAAQYKRLDYYVRVGQRTPDREPKVVGWHAHYSKTHAGPHRVQAGPILRLHTGALIYITRGGHRKSLVDLAECGYSAS